MRFRCGGRRLEPVCGAQHRPRERLHRGAGVLGGPQVGKGRNRMAQHLESLLLHPRRLRDGATAQASLHEVGPGSRQPRVGRAEEREEVAPGAPEPREAEESGQSMPESGLRKRDAALDRVGDSQRSEGRLERRPVALDAGADDRDLLGGKAGAQERQDLVTDELERPTGARRLEEAHGTVERRGLGAGLLEKRVGEMRERRCVVPVLRPQLLDPVT